MPTRPRAPAGWCPSVDAPFPTGDGALLRVRTPGGSLTTAGLRAAAEAAELGGHALELTSRANLQLRGFDEATAAAASGVLRAGGLVAPAPSDDGRRNVLAPALRGRDPEERLDVSADVLAVADLLSTSPEAAGLSDKVGVAVDGGGRHGVRSRSQDVCLTPVGGGWAVALGSPVAGVGRFVVDASPLAIVEAFVRACDALGAHSATALVEHLGQHEAELRVASLVGGVVAVVEVAPGEPTPLGRFDQADGLVALGAAPVLGRLSASTARELADLADSLGATVRLTPERGLVLLDVDPDRCDAALVQLAGLGLVVSSDHPATRVVACAGSTGCHAGLGDAQALGLAIVGSIDGVAGTFHVTGCDKRCASRSDAATTLLAVDGGWRVVRPDGWSSRGDLPIVDAATALEVARG